jgi:hypothetical protein
MERDAHGRHASRQRKVISLGKLLIRVRELTSQ